MLQREQEAKSEGSDHHLALGKEGSKNECANTLETSKQTLRIAAKTKMETPVRKPLYWKWMWSTIKSIGKEKRMLPNTTTFDFLHSEVIRNHSLTQFNLQC